MSSFEEVLFGGPRTPAEAADIAVPHVVGKTREQAEDALRAVGLKPVINEVESTETENYVYAQEPPWPAVAEREAVVTLHVNVKPKVPPDFTDRFDKIDSGLARLEDLHRELKENIQEMLEILKGGRPQTGSAKVQ